MRVLIIDDDKPFNQGISFFLKSQGMTVDSVYSGEDGSALARLYDYDIIILDLMLPDVPGYEILKYLRASGVDTPVLILSGVLLVTKKIECFGYGADDYVTKPCDKNELSARIQAIVRRSRGHAHSIIRVGQMEINLGTKVVTVGGKTLHLTSKEYALVELLCLRRGMTISKEQFLNHLYGGMDEPEMKIIDVFLCKIRRKIEKLSGGEQYIQTVWGRGYILKAENEDRRSA